MNQDSAPRSHFSHTFHKIEEIFYGTDDGHPDVRPEFIFDEVGTEGEFTPFEELYASVAPERRENIHLASVVGGFYGLNFVPLFKPSAITFFDVNPYQVTYCELILRVFRASSDAEDFLRRLSEEDYKVENDAERFIRETIAIKQRGEITPERGRSKRTLAGSWKYALRHFDLTREILDSVPVHTRLDAMQSAEFQSFVHDHRDLWIFCSNVFLFFYFDLEIQDPSNVVMMATYHNKVEIFDAGAYGLSPVRLHCRVPMAVSRLDTHS